MVVMVKIFAFIISFRSIHFVKNMVVGGIPPTFISRSNVAHFSVFIRFIFGISFVLILFTIIIMTATAAQYIRENIISIFMHISIAISIHLRLNTEDRAKISMMFFVYL